MLNQETARFDLSFQDLLVWAKPTFKCCKFGSKTRRREDSEMVEKSFESGAEKDEKLKTHLIQKKSDSEDNTKLSDSDSNPTINQSIESCADEDSGHDLNKIPNESKYGTAILKDISGVIRSDEMVAIMGTSGSGKTTLLNFLSSRSNWDANMFIDGRFYLNGNPIKHLSKYKHLIGFVPQEDIIPENLTVKEAIETYGLLRGFAEYKEKAARIIQDLGLEKCENNTIGEAGKRGISGGERKRTCIGAELMSDPKILFLDEPTTGIDAFTAVEVVGVLKRLNQERGLGIVTVIHQPRQEIVDMFDKVRAGGSTGSEFIVIWRVIECVLGVSG